MPGNEAEREAGAEVIVDGKAATVLFNRSGVPGGAISVKGANGVESCELAQGVDMSYARWKSAPRFGKWMTDKRFEPYITAEDRAKFGGGK